MLRYLLISILITDFFFAVHCCFSAASQSAKGTKLDVDLVKTKLDREGKY